MFRITLTIASLVCAAAAHATPTIDYVAFRPDSNRFDCDAQPRPVCREREDDLARLDAMLARGESMHREGDRLVFAHRVEADAVMMKGGLQYPLSRVAGTDRWTLTLRVEQLDGLVFERAFVAIRGKDMVQSRAEAWRGPSAAPAPAAAQPLQGRLREHLLMSRHLPAARKLTTYEPPVPGAIRGVVYLADGQSLPRYARYVEPLIVAGRLPPLMLVGLHAAAGNERQREYVAGLTRKARRFETHQQFFFEEALPYIERHFAVPTTRAGRLLAGASNGADWAVETALRHPERIAGVIASPWPGRSNRTSASRGRATCASTSAPACSKGTTWPPRAHCTGRWKTAASRASCRRPTAATTGTGGFRPSRPR